MEYSEKYKYLNKIDSPIDLRKLDLNDLNFVCRDLREFIIEQSSINPGHFGASLGTIELTVALHYAFNTPYDLLVWDVGHQAYAHKILTGRRDVFHTNRKYKGISGFPSPKESEYDSFGVGHSSTSISAAIGMAVAAKMNKENRQTIAIIGDGALTGGMAFEGLNNASVNNTNILIILNDNEISIDDSAGALKGYLTDIAASKAYNKMKNDVWHFLGRLNKIGLKIRGTTQKIDNAIKSIVMQNSNLFEALGIRYFGPVDGHNVVSLAELFHEIKDIPGPKLLHIKTVKGKGFQKAEKNQTLWHAPGKFDMKTGNIEQLKTTNDYAQKYQDVFGDAIVKLAKDNDKIVAITPAMLTGSSLMKMKKEFPDRCFDVGIAEQHAVTFAAGLAIQNIIPFCCIYSSFAQRAYDQIIHDVALQNLHVIFCFDRAGIVGEDGATHHGIFDLSFCRCVPNLVIAAPANEIQLRNLLYTAQLEKNNFPFVIRYPRGKSVFPKSEITFTELKIGKGMFIIKNKDIAILALGSAVNIASEAVEILEQENIYVSLCNMLFVKPLDKSLIIEVLQDHKFVITIEDNILAGGFGSAISEFITDNNYQNKLIRMGIDDIFVEHGNRDLLISAYNYDAKSICDVVRKHLEKV
ncbi:MAG: 1-deoxy-D-xylulose-5-phosphate synthase [Bacteroidales bacterium]|nr:1-deoxy-D-xylulose-5-phosphate synthase [Bacteroidales bacterium]